MPLPPVKPTDGATLFKQQCAICHTTNPAEPVRQGPSLYRIVGRPAGKVDGFHYSAGFEKAETSSGTTPGSTPGWQTRRQSFPAPFMAYRQPKAETRAAIIAYLKELN
jgi:cytochrome c